MYQRLERSRVLLRQTVSDLLHLRTGFRLRIQSVHGPVYPSQDHYKGTVQIPEDARRLVRQQATALIEHAVAAIWTAETNDQHVNAQRARLGEPSLELARPGAFWWRPERSPSAATSQATLRAVLFQFQPIPAGMRRAAGTSANHAHQLAVGGGCRQAWW